MLYAIVGTDTPDSAQRRRATRPRHLAYVEPLLEAGRLVFAGPFPAIDSPDPGPAGFSGSLIIAEFDSLETAREWAKKDPYMEEGVFSLVDVKPIIQALP